MLSKKENKSQLLKRSLTNITNNATTLVERVGVPVVMAYLNPNTNKVIFAMDSESKIILEESNALEKLEAALHASHKSGKDLKFVSDQVNFNYVKTQRILSQLVLFVIITLLLSVTSKCEVLPSVATIRY